MAKIYPDEDETLFAHVSQNMALSDTQLEDMNDEKKARIKGEDAREESSITKGQNCTIEKIKELKQCFSKEKVPGFRRNVVGQSVNFTRTLLSIYRTEWLR